MLKKKELEALVGKIAKNHESEESKLRIRRIDREVCTGTIQRIDSYMLSVVVLKKNN